MDRRSMVVAGEPVHVTSNGRRYFSKAHREAVVAKCLLPGASLAAVALANGFNANQVRRWVREHQARQVATKPETKLLPISVEPTAMRRVSEDAMSVTTLFPGSGSIELRMGRRQLLVHGLVDPGLLSVVLNALLRAR